MIPPPQALLYAYARHIREYGWEVGPPLVDLIDGVERAHSEARGLAEASGHEAAAFLFACARHSPALGEDFMLSMLRVARDREPKLRRIPERHLAAKAREIAGRVLSFDAFRAWLDERLPPPR